MGDCPKCGYPNPGPVDFCPNPQCRAYLGRASAAAPQIPAQRAASDSQPASTLRQQAASVPGAVRPPAASSVGPPMVASTAMGSSTDRDQKRGVRVTIEPDDLTVEPGGQVTTKVTVRNLGTRVEEFELVPQGPGAAFATVIPATVSVYPDVEQRAVVRLAPPRSPESTAGVSTFEVVARSVVHSDVRDVARGRLTVGAFENLQAVLQPDSSRGYKSAQHQVTVTNGGNTSVNAQVAFTDQGKVLTFEPKDKQVALQAGNAVDVPVTLNGPVKWFGRTQQLPFSATVTPAGTQPPIMLNGVRQQTAMFPWWVPPAAIALVALLVPLLLLWMLRTPKVPMIGNVDELAATKTLTDEGYVPNVIKKADPNVDKGFALGTEPPGGTPLKHGQVVKLLLSNGKCPGICPDMVRIPNVVGRQKDDAAAQLSQVGLGVVTEQKPSEETAGTVTDTKPAAATEIPSGENVTLLVSTGPKPENPAGPSGPAPGGAAPGGAAPGGPAPGGPAPGGPAPGGPAPGGPAPGGPGGPAPGGPDGPGDTPPKPVQVPTLQGSSVEAATKALTNLGLKAKVAPDPVHSNAVGDGKVLSSEPKAATQAAPGSEVTLTVAKNTTRVNLIDVADNTEKATWTATGTSKETLTFGKAGTAGGKGALVNERAGSLPSGKGTLDSNPVTKVLETRPPDKGLITGEYKLDAAIIPGDHVKALVGLVNTETADNTLEGAAIYTVEVNGRQSKPMTVKFGTPQQLDVDLSQGEGAQSIKIIVTSSGTLDPKLAPVWQTLRLEPTVGK
jgi:beta-lactam-binding protein with PASTA domain